MKRYSHCSLLEYNTFGIDQQCDELLVYENQEDAVALVKDLLGHGSSVPLLILGGGSNLLLTKDFEGKVVTADKRFEVEVGTRDEEPDNVYLRCWAGTCFDEVVAYAVDHGYYGIENLSLIPGECGASAVQNIGAYGVEAKDVIVEMEAVSLESGEVVRIAAEDCHYAYRQSRFKQEWRDKYLILYVTYRLSRTFHPHLDYGNIRKVLEDKHISEQQLTGKALREAIIKIREAKLPNPEVLGNAGSFFMNPMVDEVTLNVLKAKFPDIRYFEVNEPASGADVLSGVTGTTKYKIPAGWMIDQCGWKGRTLGRAGVYEKQALVLVNRGGAKGMEIVELMKQIQADVFNRYGLRILPEVNIK
ncbi:MAG: UDP-N-acetylmuramate dehydrogenase [Prevotella sp.]|nr:UDP-N-acetylmuramate dehydrogenase [Prevotella sp.]